MPHIVEKCFTDTGFGIDDISAADDGERYLPCVPQILQRAGRDMQVGTHFFPGEVPFFHDRGAVVVHRLLQCPFRVPYLRKAFSVSLIFAKLSLISLLSSFIEINIVRTFRVPEFAAFEVFYYLSLSYLRL